MRINAVGPSLAFTGKEGKRLGTPGSVKGSATALRALHSLTKALRGAELPSNQNNSAHIIVEFLYTFQWYFPLGNIIATYNVPKMVLRVGKYLRKLLFFLF